MTSLTRLSTGKVFKADDQYEYMCCVLKESSRENTELLRYLHYNNKLEKAHLLDLGLSRWNFYMKFGETFEFMLQRISN